MPSRVIIHISLLDSHSYISTSMAEIFFGIDIKSKEDEWYIDIAEEVMKGISEAGIPGAFLVDIIPICTSHFNIC